MILSFGKEKVDSIQKDRTAKMKFAVQAALYKVTGACDWNINIEDEVMGHKGNILYQLDIFAKRAVCLEINSGKREYRHCEFRVVSEALSMRELFTLSVIEIRKCQK